MSENLPIKNENFIVKNLFSFKYVPQILKLSIDKRKCSCFLYIIEGEYHYKSEKSDLYAKTGNAIYIPKDSKYRYVILSEKTKTLQVEFDLDKYTENGFSPVLFSDCPMLIEDKSAQLGLIFREVLKNQTTNKFKALSAFYQILSIFTTESQESIIADKGMQKIMPALEFIEKNFREKIYISQLSDLCNISQSQLRRLFQKNLGISPVKYKNKILMKTACDMLKTENMNVSEVATALKFSDIYTFSQMFKKEIGVSPKKYMDSLMKQK